ncbi:AAA family ATPase [Pseudomonas viridiflava]|uniref:AAA family ATPase n=1 Tax=Pseudomonas viridiflava TaxID=33069 RepID=UPI000F0511CA|nr:AAA family ATPase [Pseudomonas viridiflava]
MPDFKLSKLVIDEPPFRKLKRIEFEFASRITLIAGHNGIGKSTILALVANGSGLTDSDHSSYTGKTFQGNLNEIIHLDYDSEFAEKKLAKTLPRPVLEYSLDGQTFAKRCALTKRTVPATETKPERFEARVVPRNIPLRDYQIPDTETVIGSSSKVPIPTIYLGMTRMLPIGESDPDMVENSPDTLIHPLDVDFITTFVNGVIGVSAITGAKKAITTQSIKGTNKTTKHPTYSHSPKTVSLGQDSLSAIATALASFQKLKREWADYPGGLLVIDELDAGFHPHAQQKLIKSIGNTAKKLNIQVVATTHSLCLIEAIHPDANPIGAKGVYVDKVIYIRDTAHPKIKDSSLQAIRDDMNLTPPKPAPKKETKYLKVYLEDAEANRFMKALITRRVQNKVKNACGALLKPIPISVGCENLQGLQQFDSHFKTVLIAVDADSKIRTGSGRKKITNVVKLPGGSDAAGRGFNPERTIYEFVKELIESEEKYPAARQHLEDLGVTSDQLFHHLIEGDVVITKRESSKNWMKARLQIIDNWEIIGLWLAEHPDKVNAFEDELLAAAVATARLTS